MEELKVEYENLNVQKSINDVSEFIANMDIDKETNDKLIEVLVKHHNTLEREAFLAGVKRGLSFVKEVCNEMVHS